MGRRRTWRSKCRPLEGATWEEHRGWDAVYIFPMVYSVRLTVRMPR
jgi:hypothetical protein